MFVKPDNKVVIGFVTTVAPKGARRIDDAGSVTTSRQTGPFRFVVGFDHSRDDIIEETRSAGLQRLPEGELTAVDAFIGDLGGYE